MSRFVAVGDVHGCSQTLAVLLDLLGLAPGDTLLTAGDLSAKGIDSKGVHQQLLDLEASGIGLIPLVGNHELMLLAAQRFLGVHLDLKEIPASMLHEAEISFFIRGNGGWSTLKSYGFSSVDDKQFWAFSAAHAREHFEAVANEIRQLNWVLPADHLSLLSRCKTHHIGRNCLFVHAGLRPDLLSLPSAEEAVATQLQMGGKDLCWNRDWLGTQPAFPELLVHGHTPLFCLYPYLDDTTPWKDDKLLFKSTVHAGALNLDSGAFLDSGHLTAVEIPEDGNPQEMRFLRVPRIDPVEKDPLWYVNFTS